MNEQLSAFLDGETTQEQTESVLGELLKDEQLQSSWQRQHWVRHVLTTPAYEPPVALEADFASQVMQKIHAAEAPAKSSKVIRLLTRPKPRSMRGLTRFALAASVAGVAIFVTSLWWQESDLTANQILAIASSANEPVTQESQLAKADEPTPAAAKVETPLYEHWGVSDPALATQLDNYLADHTGWSRGYGMNVGTTGFVRVASYGRGADE